MNEQQENLDSKNLKDKPSLLQRIHGNKNAQIALLLFSVIYLISPIDIIPDAIPVVGILDDIGLIMAEVIQFLVYLNNQKSAINKNAKHKRR